MRAVVRAVVTAGLLPLLVACGDDGEQADPGTTATIGSTAVAVEGAPAPDDRTLPLRFQATVSGDLDVKVDSEIDVRVLRVIAEDAQYESLRLLSVGPAEPVQLPDGAAFRVAFDLSRYEEDGEYTIQAGSPRDRATSADAGLPTPSGLDMSNVLIQHWPNGDARLQPDIFDNALSPCFLKVEDEGRSGTLRCAGMRNDADGREVAVEMTWG